MLGKDTSMKITPWICQLIVSTTIFFLNTACHGRTPLWTFTPQTATTVSVSKDGKATIQYTITNHSKKALTLMMSPMKGIHQATNAGSCSRRFTLNGSQSCTLTLHVIGKHLHGGVLGGPIVCERDHPLHCHQPSPSHRLAINRYNGSFLAIADIHYDQRVHTPITYGEDTGVRLWDNMQKELATVIAMQKPKFVVYLGDSPAHTEKNRKQNSQAVLSSFSNKMTIPFFYVNGNNDSLLMDYGPFSQKGINLFSLDPTHHWPAMNVTRCPARTACVYSDKTSDMANAQTFGFYSAYPLGSITPLRLIVLNSVIFSYMYAVPPGEQQADAQLEMDWFATQLRDAQSKKEQVYIAMHIPVGHDSLNPIHHDMWNASIILNGHETPSIEGLSLRNGFLNLLITYKNTIRALVSGHTHKETYRVIHADSTYYNPTVLALGVRGVSPMFGNNPGMQVYFYDNIYRLMDAKTFYTTPDPGEWYNTYFRSDYACPPNTTMHTCILNQGIPSVELLSLFDPIYLFFQDFFELRTCLKSFYQ